MTDPYRPEDEMADLVFFGTITASVSHELNNIISTIDQVSGLLADHLASLDAGQLASPQRIRDVRERIVKQTLRASATIERLRTFAHGVDEPQRKFELQETLANLLALSERLASQKRVELTVDSADEPIWVTSRPFRLQHVLFNCLRRFWEAAPSQASVQVSVRRDGENVRIVINGPAWQTTESTAEPDEALHTMMAELAGTATVTETDKRGICELVIPITPPADCPGV